MYCKRCGTQRIKNDKFCTSCGTQFDTSPNKEHAKHSLTGSPKENEVNGHFLYRLGAGVIDLGLVLIALIGLYIYFPGLVPAEGSDAELYSWLGFLLGYHLIANASTSTTFGKWLLGMRIINKETHDRVGFGKSLLRAIGYFFSSLVFGLGFLFIAFEKKKRGWHDHIAGTLVVRNKSWNTFLGFFLAVVSVVGIGYILWLGTDDTTYYTPTSYSSEEYTANSHEDSLDPVQQADYDEGLKAGYADGRSSLGQLGDSYFPPATESRRDAYALGYLDGFLQGCDEGFFDCSEVEAAIMNLYLDDGGTNQDLFSTQQI